ncbi:MAG: M20 family metallopeptidase [Candidatus Aminicenantes bacterium]|nr:M20 family metallopeptidase [Candidatus Aminicenantes bacterium]
MNFYKYFNSQKKQMIDFLKYITCLESPSSDKNSVDKCSAYVLKELKRIGLNVTSFPQKKIGDIYVAEFPSSGQETEKDFVLILSHIDTVWPVGKIKTMPFRISGDKIYGPGVLDMKAGILMAVFVFKAFKELKIFPRKKIVFFINSAEEIGSEEAYIIIRNLAKKSSYVLCLEPSLPGGALKIQRKGRIVIQLTAHGKAAHAGTPEKGINAIEELCCQLQKLRKIRTNGITANIGQIQGGEKANIVAEKASAILDIRFWKNSDKEKVMEFFKQLKPVIPMAKIDFKVESFTPPMEKTKASMQLFEKIRKIGQSLNQDLTSGKTGGGSDASIAANMGIPTLDGLGADGEGIHAENEHLLISSLIPRTTLLAEILTTIGDSPHS